MYSSYGRKSSTIEPFSTNKRHNKNLSVNFTRPYESGGDGYLRCLQIEQELGFKPANVRERLHDIVSMVTEFMISQSI